jgi:hypothetical protein
MTDQPTPTCGNLTPHPAHTVQPDADDPSEPMTCLGVWNLAAEPSGDPDPTWIALLDRARAGGEDAADAIIDAYSRGIRAGVDRMTAATTNTEETADSAAHRFATELEALARQLADRGIDIGADPVGAAIAHIDRLDTALTEATRDRLTAWQRDILDRVRTPTGELEAIIDGGLTTDQEIRDSATAYSARVLQGALTRYADPEAVTAAARAVLTLAQTVEPYIRDGEIPVEGDALDAQAAVDIAHERYARAVNDEERSEVISELIGDWLAAWPRTALTDPWDALAPEIVRMTRREERP